MNNRFAHKSLKLRVPYFDRLDEIQNRVIGDKSYVTRNISFSLLKNSPNVSYQQRSDKELPEEELIEEVNEGGSFSNVEVPPEWKIEPKYYLDYKNYMQTKSPHHLNSLLKKLKSVIDLGVRSYSSSKNKTAEIIVKNLIIKSLPKYNPKQTSLKNFLLSQMKGLYRQTESNPLTIHIPEQWVLDNRNVRIAEQELINELGRQPSDAEIADYLKIPLNRVIRARKVPAINPDTAFVDASAISEKNLGNSQNTQILKTWIETIYSELNPKDQIILEHSLDEPLNIFNKPKLSDKELAQKLNISLANVSQRKARIQNKINEIYKLIGN